MKSQFQKRLESFAWRTGMMVLAVVIDWAMQNYGLLNISPQFTVLLGLILGEISKAVKGELEIRAELKKLG